MDVALVCIAPLSQEVGGSLPELTLHSTSTCLTQPLQLPADNWGGGGERGADLNSCPSPLPQQMGTLFNSTILSFILTLQARVIIHLLASMEISAVISSLSA